MTWPRSKHEYVAQFLTHQGETALHNFTIVDRPAKHYVIANTMKLFGEIGGATSEGAGSKY